MSVAAPRGRRLPRRGSPALVALGFATAALLALVVPVLLAGGRPLGIDLAAARLLQRPDSVLAEALTQLGSGAVLYPVLVALGVIRRSRGASWRRSVTPLLVLAAAQTVEAVLFVTVSRPSPVAGHEVSFSSGHALTATLGWGLLALEVSAGWRTPRSGRIPAAMPAALAVATLVGLTRVVLGLHWLTDVAVGWALAGAVLMLYGAAPELAATADPVADPSGDRPGGEGSSGGSGREAAAGRQAPAPQAVAERARRWLSCSPLAWALPAVAALVPLVPLLTVAGPDRMKDLLVYVGAGGTAGTGADVYEFRTVFEMPFTYPPFAAVLSEPLSRVPLGLLQALWVAATLVALVGVARIGMRPVVTRIGLPATLALLLVSAPVRSHLRFGQVGLFLVLLVAADLLRPHRRGQGLGLGIATAVKLTPAVFLPWLVVVGKRRTLATAVATAVGATVAGLLLLWPSAKEYLWRALWDSDRFGANDVVGNQSVRGMLLRAGLSDRQVALAWLGSALVLTVVGTLGARRLERNGDRLGALGVLAALSVAVSPISWVHHLVWLSLPLAALVAAGRHWLAAAWALLLTLSLPSMGAAGLRAGTGSPVFWQFVVDGQGLTAVAAVLVLPALLAVSEKRHLPPHHPALLVSPSSGY